MNKIRNFLKDSGNPGRMKRKAAVLALGAVLISAPGCAALQSLIQGGKPKLSFEKAELKGFSLTGLDLRLHMNVWNPYPIDLPKGIMKLNMNIEGANLAKLSTLPLTLKGRENTPTVFNVNIKYADLKAIYDRLPGKEALDVKLGGNLEVPLPTASKNNPAMALLPKNLNFAFQGERKIPAVLPDISIQNFRIHYPTTADIQKSVTSGFNKDAVVKKASGFLYDLLKKKSGRSPGSAVSAGLAGIDLEVKTEFDIVLKNLAASRLDFKNLDYTLNLDGNRFLSGKPSTISNENRETTVTIKTAFPLKSITTSLARSIKTKSVNFNLIGGAGLEIPALPADGLLRYRFNKNGRFNW